MAQEDTRVYWIVPVAALALVLVGLFPFILNHQATTIMPNAQVELQGLKLMSCKEISARDSIGSYWTPKNGKYARDIIQDCKDLALAYKEKLRDIRTTGTHEDKTDAGFTQLWFGVYDHKFLPFSKSMTLFTILPGTISNEELFPTEFNVIVGYNNTIKVTNLDDVGWVVTSNDRDMSFFTGLLAPNDTASFTLREPGSYGYHSKPWLTGTINVLPLEKES